MQKKYNQKFLKSNNQSRIIKLLREKGPLSRAQIAKELGIVRSTASEICNEMISLKLINEGKKIEGNLGKRPILLNFNKNFYYFIAVVFTAKHINIAVSNLNSEIIREEIIDYEKATISVKKIIELSLNKVDEIINDLGLNKICLISLGSPETLNIKTGKIVWAPYIRDWEGIDLKTLFYDRYKIDTIVKEHIKLETIGEHWKSYSNISNLIYITITYGIGSGAIVDGKLREGENGYLGEIAFLPISENINHEELIKGNKKIGYFESKCDIVRIIEITDKYLSERSDSRYFKRTRSFDDIAFLYKTDNDVASMINKEIIKTLALGIASVIVVLDPEIVVINGEIAGLGNNFLKSLREEIYKVIPYRTKIVFSKLGDKTRIFGAIKNGLDYINKLMYEDLETFYKKGEIISLK